MRRHGAKNADYRGGVTCLYDTQLLGICLHASESGGRSRPEAVRGTSVAPIIHTYIRPPEESGPQPQPGLGCRVGQPSIVFHKGGWGAFAQGFPLIQGSERAMIWVVDRRQI